MRAMVSSSKGAGPGIEARGQFDALIESVLPRGGVPGLWVHRIGRQPRRSSTCTVVGLTFGSAKAYRHLVGHITARAGEGVYPGLSACSRISICGCHGRRAGMLPRTCREGRSPDCSYGRLRCRQSGTRTRVARYRRSRLHQRDSCRSCRVVAGYRPNPIGHDLRDARGCRSSL